ncbi:MAG: hypothetical protein H0V55_03685, partial [Thermoleophilaceae bacterium]|nr:hypothetical protein [Thermoleophilaceae bacterium]
MAPRLGQLVRGAGQLEDPDQGLRAVAGLRRTLESLEAAHVEVAVRAGWSWSRIAGALGVTKQAAH